MIYILKNGKFKPTKYQLAKELKDSSNADEILFAEKLNKELSKGNDVYCWISPFHETVRDQIIINWGNDSKLELIKYNDSMESI